MNILNTPEQIARMRLATIKLGLEVELRGFRLTTRAPKCFSIIKKEYGIKGDKLKAYREFCSRFGFDAKEF